MPRAGPMPVISIASTQDLRSRAVDRKRDRENKAKWSPKWGALGHPVVKIGPNDTVRPCKLESQRVAIKERHEGNKKIRQVHQLKKRPALNDDEASPDTSADEELADSKVPGEECYTYSFDASRGPAQGNEIFEMALNKAVERYEDQETTKLVQAEYDVLEVGGEEATTSGQADSDEDDFEFI